MSEEIKTWRYYLPSGDGQEWAEIVLVSTGMFAAVSDWGNYAHAWRSFGECFRSFVARIASSSCYVCSKLSREEYDGEATEAAIKEEIIRLRRADEITAELARDFWNELEEHDVSHSEAGFAIWYSESDGAQAMPEAHSLTERNYPPGVRAFCERILPRLAEAIRAELDAERSAA